MRLLQPDSFPKLLVIGFAMVALPLIIALVNNAISIDQFANRSQHAVHQAVQSTQSSRRLAELLAALERNARQVVILGNRTPLKAYEANRDSFLQAAAEFGALPLDEEQRVALTAIVGGEAQNYAVLRDPGAAPTDIARAAGAYAKLNTHAVEIIAHGDRVIDREIEAMQQMAGRAQRITFWQMLALVPVAFLLAAGFTVLIARPIRQIDAAHAHGIAALEDAHIANLEPDALAAHRRQQHIILVRAKLHINNALALIELHGNLAGAVDL